MSAERKTSSIRSFPTISRTRARSAGGADPGVPAVEDMNGAPGVEKFLLEGARDRALSRPDESRQDDCRGFLAEAARAVRRRHLALPAFCVALARQFDQLAQPLVRLLGLAIEDHPGGDGAVGQSIDQDERAGRAVFPV